MRTQKNRAILDLQKLEDRLTPSFDFYYSPFSDTWTFTQVQDDGDITVAIEAGGQYVVTDGAGAATVGFAGANLNIKLMNNAQNELTIDDTVDLTGNASIDLGNGASTLTMTTNVFGGNLTVRGGTGSQEVDLGGAIVGGTTNVDLGLGADTLTTGALITGSDLTVRGVDNLDASAGISVGRNVLLQPGTDTVGSISDLSGAVIGGSFTYQGNTNSSDTVTLDAAVIGTNANITLGNSTVMDTQVVDLSATTIGANLTITGGSINGADEIITTDTTVVGGNIYINTGTLGNDTVTLLGTIGGSSVTLLAGLGNNVVEYGMIGSNVRLSANLGLGSDTFTLGLDATLSYLSIDFGAGVDTYVNNFGGPYTFPVILRNLP